MTESELALRILFIGDIVGKPGERIVTQSIQKLRERESLDFVVANAENAEEGSGLRCAAYKRLVSAGIDAFTLGDHIYKKKEIISVLESQSNIVKPANFPAEAPGKEWVIVNSKDGVPVALFCLMGRVFMRPVDCPFHAADRVLKQIPDEVRVRIVDVHAEATSDKQLIGRYLDGRVSAVLGTHTHVPTADEQILPAGTAFQCDVGMTGPHLSILGRKIDPVTLTTTTFRPASFQVANDDVRINGAIVEVDTETGKATEIRRFVLTEQEAENLA